MRYLTDDQFDEILEGLQGMRYSLKEYIDSSEFAGLKPTKEQKQFLQENMKRCRKCKCWIGICDCCNCL